MPALSLTDGINRAHFDTAGDPDGFQDGGPEPHKAPSAPSLNFLSLSPQIHERIFELICEPRTGILYAPVLPAEAGGQDDWTRLLYPCCLIAKACFDPAMKVLYRTVVIEDSFRMKYLRRSLTLNPSLGYRVCSLMIDMLRVKNPHDDAFARSSVYRLLDHCVRLRRLAVRGCDDSFHGQTAIQSARCFGPYLSSFSLTPLQAPRFCIHSVAPYFGKFKLSSVSLDCFVSTRLASVLNDFVPPVLTSLTLTRAAINLKDLRALLKRSLITLRSFVLDLYPVHLDLPIGTETNLAAAPGFYTVLQGLPKEMERLELYWRNVDFRLLEVVCHYPHLRRLGWGGPLAAASVLRHLPRTLEELLVERCSSVTPDKVIRLLEDGKLCKLVEVEVGQGMNWGKAEWDGVRLAAKNKRVVVGHAKTVNGAKYEPDFQKRWEMLPR